MGPRQMKVLGIDLETQSLDKETRITEIGAVLVDYDFATKTWTRLEAFSHLCWEPNYPPQPLNIIELTGITDHMLITKGAPRDVVIREQLLPLMNEAELLVAHNKKFEMDVLGSTFEELGIAMPDKEWLCTRSEIDYPPKFTCHKLAHLAYDHGILVPPSELHRADQDVELMLRLLAKYNFEQVLAYYREPWVLLKAKILGPWDGPGGDGGIQKGIATGLGFSYEKPRGTYHLNFPKTWVARIKESRADVIIEAALSSASPFRVSRLQ